MRFDPRRALGRLGHWIREDPRGAALTLAASLAIAGLAIGGYVKGSGRFSEERAKAVRDESTYRAALLEIRDERTKRPKLDAGIRSFVDRTLGDTAEACDAQLRSRLNRLGEEVGLRDLRVTTGSASTRTSPAKAEFGRSGRDRGLRDETDFVELDATLTGEGSLEQVLKAIHRIDIDPWIKRIDAIRLDGLREGERIKLSLQLTTLFLPGLERAVDLKVADSDLGGFVRYRGFVEANPFRVPAPPVVAKSPPAAAPAPGPAAPAPESAPPPVVGFPYDQWQLTGLVSGPTGQEAFLRNTADQRSATLIPGQSLGDVTFLGFTADLAEFAAGESRFRVQVGSSLSSRLPPA